MIKSKKTIKLEKLEKYVQNLECALGNLPAITVGLTWGLENVDDKTTDAGIEAIQIGFYLDHLNEIRQEYYDDNEVVGL